MMKDATVLQYVIDKYGHNRGADDCMAPWQPSHPFRDGLVMELPLADAKQPGPN